MKLPNDVCRCGGVQHNAPFTPIRCIKRGMCERYLQRLEGGERTPYMDYVCNSQFDSFIEVSNEPLPHEG